MSLVTATNKNSAIGVLFDVDYDVIVKKPCFQRGSTLKFLKNFRTLFFSNFRATPWSNNFNSTNQKAVRKARTFAMFTSFCLSGRAGSLLPMFTCVTVSLRQVKTHAFKTRLTGRQWTHTQPTSLETFCTCWLVQAKSSK